MQPGSLSDGKIVLVPSPTVELPVALLEISVVIVYVPAWSAVNGRPEAAVTVKDELVLACTFWIHSLRAELAGRFQLYTASPEFTGLTAAFVGDRVRVIDDEYPVSVVTFMVVSAFFVVSTLNPELGRLSETTYEPSVRVPRFDEDTEFATACDETVREPPTVQAPALAPLTWQLGLTDPETFAQPCGIRSAGSSKDNTFCANFCFRVCDNSPYLANAIDSLNSRPIAYQSFLSFQQTAMSVSLKPTG